MWHPLPRPEPKSSVEHFRPGPRICFFCALSLCFLNWFLMVFCFLMLFELVLLMFQVAFKLFLSFFWVRLFRNDQFQFSSVRSPFRQPRALSHQSQRPAKAAECILLRGNRCHGIHRSGNIPFGAAPKPTLLWGHGFYPAILCQTRSVCSYQKKMLV